MGPQTPLSPLVLGAPVLSGPGEYTSVGPRHWLLSWWQSQGDQMGHAAGEGALWRKDAAGFLMQAEDRDGDGR